MSDQIFLLLGGAGLVGSQIARQIAATLAPQRIIIVALTQDEVEAALATLQSLFDGTKIEFIGEWGDVFTRTAISTKPRSDYLAQPRLREALFEDIYGPIDGAYERSRLVALIEKYRPDVVVDSINTATAISYQDIFSAANKVHRAISAVAADGEALAKVEAAVDHLLISQAVPQLVRHVTLVNEALRRAGTRLYLKIGTTGTGGMGLNIPYTHGEDRPSAVLMSKTALGFAHTGLLFLMARTAGGPIVKELKPAAMIGYADVAVLPIEEHGQPVLLYDSRSDRLDGRLALRDNDHSFQAHGALSLPVIDTGENGVFTLGEFEAITSLRQMEFITPEEIAAKAVLEICGDSSGNNILAALDAAVMDPSYRAGYLRQQALDELTTLRDETQSYSVALGQLGPPELSKLLWEAELLRICCGTLAAAVDSDAEELSRQLAGLVQRNARLRRTIVSTGVPILLPDGERLLRGPLIRIPEVREGDAVAVDSEKIDRYAQKGWVDLRQSNVALWQRRFAAIGDRQQQMRVRGSAAIRRQGYIFSEIRPGTMVGWIFNNEHDAYRIK